MEQLKQIYTEDIQDFKEVGHQFVNGTISSAEFKASSGGMGVYAQRGGKELMIRLRILSGVLDLKTLHLIKELAIEHSLKNIHLTTRQAIQLHNLKFDEIIDIMEKCLEIDLYTRGGGGNFPRNVSLSPLSGVEENEVFDVTPYAIKVNKYFISNMNSYKLPRKFKVAFSNNSNDTANASIADLGFLAVKQGDKELFQVYIGGSLGANSGVSVPYDELIDPEDVLLHVNATLSLFTEEGDYENKGKARMRFIVKRMGEGAFLECYKKHLEKVKKQQLEFEINSDHEVTLDAIEGEKLEHCNVVAQKQKGYYTVVLHPKGGLLKTEDLSNILAFLKKVPLAQIRLSMEESMLIRNLTATEAKELLELTQELRKTTKLSRTICCIGVPTCQIGVQESQGLLNSILDTFNEKRMTEDILPSLHISGCLNSCARHQVSEIGFHGKKKRVNEQVEDVYALHIGGKASQQDTHLAKEYGDLLAASIPEFLYELALKLKEQNVDFNKYLETHKEEFETLINKYLIG